MQSIIKLLRWLVLLAIIVVMLVIYVSFNRNAQRGHPQSEPVTSTQRPGTDKPMGESKTFEDVQTIGGKVVSRIRAERVVAFESGWTTLENVQLTLFRDKGLTYELTCPQAEFNSTTKEAEAKGGVRLMSSDGVDIKTAEMRYDGTRLTNNIPVEFRVDRWTGKAGALDMDVPNETLRLFKKLSALMTPAKPAEAPMTLASEDATFHRRENNVVFNKGVELRRAAERMRADVVTGRFSQDRKQLTGLEGHGHTVIVMSADPNPGENLGGRKEITCDVFFTELGPDGQINAINAQSEQNIAHAVLDGPPKRDIVARTFRIGLVNREVNEIKADWTVVLKELGEIPREINSDHVTVSFDHAVHKARSAFFDGNFRYKDPRNTASAFRANYDIFGDKVVLTTDPGWQATVVSDGSTLKAKMIEFSPKAQTARATGSVIAQLTSKGKGATADTTGLFPSGKPVFVNADDLMMRQANKTALFTGHVKAWQETNTLLSSELQVQGNGENVTARGGVRTLLYNTGTEARKTPVQSTSDQLVARRADRRIDLLGNVSIVDETRSMKSQKATFFFDENRKIQRIESENGVTVLETPTQRKGVGDKTVYQVDKKMIYLYGSPATVTDPTGSVAGEQILFDLAKNRVNVVSPKGETKGTYKNETH
jgi:LPS export ABC transporter protein LptC/lipopolysaccharide transport protein LptA